MISPENRGQSPAEQNLKRWQNQAKLAHELVRGDGQDRCLIMIVDDLWTKLDEAKKDFGRVTDDLGLDVVFTTYQTGEDAVGFFTAFMEEDQRDNPVQIGVIMDNDLQGLSGKPGSYPTGVEVTSKMIELCQEKGWKTPLFFSNSLIDSNNERFDNRFPEHVIPGGSQFGFIRELKRRKDTASLDN